MGENLSFEEVAKQWFSDKKKTVKITTEERYEIILDRYLCPYFGKLRITDINATLVNCFAAESLEILNANTVSLIFCVLKSIINFAIRYSRQICGILCVGEGRAGSSCFFVFMSELYQNTFALPATPDVLVNGSVKIFLLIHNLCYENFILL